ncbi:hypothetical protein SAMN05444166_7629 [Singulisphaera sp. GP187]|uniref:hypothetical protein n=1 Tax=Singulisphaera sp. GP187 TaxID=1882752 RepID=UPI00092B3D84|nr:hypothetical protein [Singulisphaera sp. GP187]SIO65222.1 hypothetical protein SAMN05444166_7629 [Singulisphaera sp. GP187]
MTFNWPTWLPTRDYRLRYRIMLFLALLAPIVGTGRCPAAAAEGGPDLNGIWKLVGQTPGDSEWAIFEVKKADGKPIVEIIDGVKVFGKSQIYLEKSADGIVVLLAYEQGDVTFKGRLHEDGGDDRIVGAMQFRASGMASTSGARLERTRATKLAEPSEPPEKRGFMATFGLLPELQKATAEFLNDRYKSLELTTATVAADGIRIDAPTTTRAWAVSRLVDVARRAGKADVVAETELAKLKALIAEEGRPPTVPLVVEPFAGRRDSDGDQVVLVELFTGAQCGPCVAADIAFDALSAAYKPIDLITFQYHLHIPGPDPLTGPDSVSRQDYYRVRSTPSTYFNGRAMAGSGGSVGDSRRKFNQYRHVIDELLKGKREATIELVAHRTGDEVHITASAKVDRRAGTSTRNPRLRLALVEESVPYSGSNRLPSHHYVVRALPGGAEGRALEGGKIRIEESINLSKVRSMQEAYLKGYPNSPESRGAFPNPLPPVELKKLRVAAFLQDDSDRLVLDAIIVPVD